MRVILSDIPEIKTGETDILKSPKTVLNPQHCIGCFGCWVKTPGQCVIQDDFSDMGHLFGTCTELIFISKCTYGGVSPFIQNALDRSISSFSPDFEVRNKELHHKKRYDNHITLSVYFYGAQTQKEMDTAKDLISAIAINYDATLKQVSFLKNEEEIREVFV